MLGVGIECSVVDVQVNLSLGKLKMSLYSKLTKSKFFLLRLNVAFSASCISYFVC